MFGKLAYSKSVHVQQYIKSISLTKFKNSLYLVFDFLSNLSINKNIYLQGKSTVHVSGQASTVLGGAIEDTR